MEVRCCCRHRILLQSLGLDLEWCLDSDKTSRIYTEKNAWNETNDSFYTGISAIILEGWVYERLGKSHSPIWNLCCSDLGGQRNLLFGVRQLFKKNNLMPCHIWWTELKIRKHLWPGMLIFDVAETIYFRVHLCIIKFLGVCYAE